MLIHDVMLKRILLPLLSQHRDSRTKVRRAQKIFINLSDARDILIIRIWNRYIEHQRIRPISTW